MRGGCKWCAMKTKLDVIIDINRNYIKASPTKCQWRHPENHAVDHLLPDDCWPQQQQIMPYSKYNVFLFVWCVHVSSYYETCCKPKKSNKQAQRFVLQLWLSAASNWKQTDRLTNQPSQSKLTNRFCLKYKKWYKKRGQKLN